MYDPNGQAMAVSKADISERKMLDVFSGHFDLFDSSTVRCKSHFMHEYLFIKHLFGKMTHSPDVNSIIYFSCVFVSLTNPFKKLRLSNIHLSLLCIHKQKPPVSISQMNRTTTAKLLCKNRFKCERADQQKNELSSAVGLCVFVLRAGSTEAKHH